MLKADYNGYMTEAIKQSQYAKSVKDKYAAKKHFDNAKNMMFRAEAYFIE